VVQATGVAEQAELRLGEGEFPPELDRVNFGAFLLAFLWAPFHRLWGWFGVFVVLEALESAMGLSPPRFFGGLVRATCGDGGLQNRVMDGDRRVCPSSQPSRLDRTAQAGSTNER
jgi:hypothetical protein